MTAITDLSSVAGSTLTIADYFVVNDSGTDKKLPASDVGLRGVAGTWSVAQTFSVAPKVPGAIGAETFALDTAAGGGANLTTGTSLPISTSGAFAGLVMAINSTSGTFGFAACSGGSVTFIQSSGSAWGSTSGANANNIFYSGGKYWLENNSGATVFYYVMALRVRDAA